jgi:hypothetical protein
MRPSSKVDRLAMATFERDRACSKPDLADPSLAPGHSSILRNHSHSAPANELCPVWAISNASSGTAFWSRVNVLQARF